jgi:hypothetical protein
MGCDHPFTNKTLHEADFGIPNALTPIQGVFFPLDYKDIVMHTNQKTNSIKGMLLAFPRFAEAQGLGWFFRKRDRRLVCCFCFSGVC